MELTFFANLAYIFSPKACGVTLSKAASLRLSGLRACLAQFSYVMQHIPDAENHWGDLLSRWRMMEDESRPCVRAYAIAVVGPAMGEFNMPSKGEIRNRQLDTPLGQLVRHEDELYQAEYGGASVLWIPHEDSVLQARPIVCSNVQDTEHRGVKGTTHRLGA